MRNSTIKPFKETQCIDCLSEGNDKIKKTISKRCFEYPFHYQKYKEGVYKERAEKKSLIEIATPIVEEMSWNMLKINNAVNKAQQAPKVNKPISKVSEKRKKENQLYSVLKWNYMKRRPYCEASLTGCQTTAIDIHHLYSGADRSKYFLDDSTYKAVCRSCHDKIHNELSSAHLIALGLRLKD